MCPVGGIWVDYGNAALTLEGSLEPYDFEKCGHGSVGEGGGGGVVIRVVLGDGCRYCWIVRGTGGICGK